MTSVSIPGIDRGYAWQEAWGELPAPADPRAWAHPGLTVASSGDVLVVDADRPLVHILDTAGRLQRSIELPVAEAHGLAFDETGGTPTLWVVDPGFKLRARGAERLVDGPGSGRVLQLDLDGQVLTSIGVPPHPAYAEVPFKPTAVCLSGSPGDQTLWIADGYGASLVHRYRPDGTYLGTIAGGDDADLRFRTPHAVFIDDRTGDPGLLVTDRIGRRLQAFDLDGRFRGTMAEGVLTSPSAIARMGDLLIVAELNASLAVLDPEGRLIGRVGDRVEEVTLPDWPNGRDAQGDLVRSPRILPGGFHAPHGLAVGADGSIYVAEFVLGGRLIRLAPD